MTATIAWHDGPRTALRPLFELADDSAEQIDAYIDRGRVLVARNDADEIIGHAQLVPGEPPDTIELASIAVLPAFRGRGVGRALVEHALAACRADGARAVRVTTATADIDNVRFYQRRGFRATSVERDAFTETNGYPPGLEADGIPVRDSISFVIELRDAHHDDQTKGSAMTTKGVIVRLEAKSGKEETVAGFLRDALPLVQQEPQTIAWFALRIDDSSFAIVDVFPDEAGRRAHLDGAVAAALEEHGLELLAQPPQIELVDVLAAKLP